jgi:predicted O-methyltransferase YrrM
VNIAKAASVLPLIVKLKTLKQSGSDTLVEFSLSHRVIKPLQVRSELQRFAALVANLKPKAVLEVGTCLGGTLFVLSRLADEGATIISVDLPGGKFGGGYQWLRTPIYKCFPRRGQRLHLIRGNSHDVKTQATVKHILGSQKLDLLFIDGDHTYDGVKRDFTLYAPLVRKGGVVAFHDIAEHSRETGSEVSRFWNEINQHYSHEEIIEDRKQGWAGIGILAA